MFKEVVDKEAKMVDKKWIYIAGNGFRCDSEELDCPGYIASEWLSPDLNPGVLIQIWRSCTLYCICV